jgi:hypothetical protein
VLPKTVKQGIKRADRISAWLEAVQLAGFSEAEADRFFWQTEPEQLITGLTLHLRAPAEVRAGLHRSSRRSSGRIVSDLTSARRTRRRPRHRRHAVSRSRIGRHIGDPGARRRRHDPQWMALAPARSNWHVAEAESGEIFGLQWIEPMPVCRPRPAASRPSFAGSAAARHRIALFPATERAARALGYRWINATIRADNEGGIVYYQSRGFRVWKRHDVEIAPASGVWWIGSAPATTSTRSHAARLTECRARATSVAGPSGRVRSGPGTSALDAPARSSEADWTMLFSYFLGACGIAESETWRGSYRL